MIEIPMKTLGNSDIQVSALGLGCMGLSEFYGEPVPEKAAHKLIRHALNNGVNFFDTADMYGSGHNEKLLASALKGLRDKAVIATKFGIIRAEGEYARNICGTPEYVRKACHASLKRLETDCIDLYYIHRLDPDTPIEDTIGEMSRLAEEGKIRAIGLSEASADSLRRAHAVHPVSSLQSEYSMLTRDPEDEVLGLTETLGISFVPYSPVCRGLLSNWVPSQDGSDFRNALPRFQGEAYRNNRSIADSLSDLADRRGCTPAQLSLAWVCARGDHLIPIPGTTKIRNLDANTASLRIKLSDEDLAAIESVLTNREVQGDRYTAEGMKGVNV